MLTSSISYAFDVRWLWSKTPLTAGKWNSYLLMVVWNTTENIQLSSKPAVYSGNASNTMAG